MQPGSSSDDMQTNYAERESKKYALYKESLDTLSFNRYIAISSHHAF